MTRAGERGGWWRTRGPRLVLWLTLLATVPVPLIVVGKGWVPTGTLVQLAVATAAVAVVERADGVVKTLGGFLVGQALLWTVVAWALSALVVRSVRRVAPGWAYAAPLLLAIALAVVAALFPVFSSPFDASLARQTLLEVYR